MTDDEIRKRVRARLADRTLPHDPPIIAQPVVPGQPTQVGLVGGSALPDPCAVCDERATQMCYTRPTGSRLAFHQRCHEIWREEAEKPIRRG
jgi:hypothetical protein